MKDRTTGILSYNHNGRWRVCKVLIEAVDKDWVRLTLHPTAQAHQVQLAEGQPVGVSFKCGYCKIIFDTQVVQLRTTAEDTAIIVATPDQVDTIDRRSYFRVRVPSCLRVDVLIWPRSAGEPQPGPQDAGWCGQLVDISAGGAQVAIPVDNRKRLDLRPCQYIWVRFTPLPYQRPITFVAQVRTILPTADGSAVCIGLQAVGLEASKAGRQTLARLLDAISQYARMGQVHT